MCLASIVFCKTPCAALICGELTYAVLNGGVEGVDNGRTAVGDPVGLVDGLAQFSEQILRAE